MDQTTPSLSGSRDTLAAVFGLGALASTFVLWALIGNPAAYVALILTVPAILLGWRRERWIAVLTAPWVWALWSAFALIALAFLLQPGGESIPNIGDFAMLALAPLIALAVAPAAARGLTLERFGWLLCLATVLAALVGVLGKLDGGNRVTAPNFSPIHFADLAVMLGFMALVAIFAGNGRWRWAVALAPLLGIVASIASGTRAALLLACVLAVVFGLFLIRRLAIPLWGKVLLPIVLAAAMLGLFYVASLLGFTRPMDALGSIGRLLSGDIWTETSSAYRVEMYRASWFAFFDSPLIGHGWHGQIEAAFPYFSERAQEGYERQQWGYIHNDALSLAVSAGILGFAAYCLMLAAPFLALRKRRVTEARLYLAVVFVVGLFASGATDVLLMVEIPKLMLVVLPAALFFVRDERA